MLTLARLRVRTLGWLLLGLMLASMIGLRYQVGTDWYNYIGGYYDPSRTMSLLDALTASDPAFVLLNWVTTHLGVGIWLVNSFAGVVFVTGLIRFVRRLPEPLLAFTAAIPYVGIVVAMNYTRQAVAIGFVLWALPYLYDRRIARYLITIFIAATFHKSAVIFLPLVALASDRNKLGVVLVALFSAVFGYFVLLSEYINGLVNQYVASGYSQASQGAPFRVAMDALPAIVLLLARHRLQMNPVEKRVWIWISLASLVAMVLVFRAPTAVDRVALYFSPIQFVIASYIPRLITTNSRVLIRAVTITVYAGVLYVWLNYAANSYAWFPYQFYPLAG
ncbi:EpsG family protein [Salinisphaera hydrothermalis]|uniref:EpsG family protein n=1 Tax=Salinisphaera hydrothermalis TaxID=563188 RepID=UPI00333F8C8A